jgi:hypothetical protein
MYSRILFKLKHHMQALELRDLYSLYNAKKITYCTCAIRATN